MHVCDDGQSFAKDFLSFYYGSWGLKDGLQNGVQLEWKCPSIEEAPECFCLTERELNLFCAYQVSICQKRISFYSNQIPLPIVEESAVQHYLSFLEECKTSYKKREGLKHRHDIRQFTNTDKKRMFSILSEAYVLFWSIARGDSTTATLNRDVWKDRLINILAGFLYCDYEFAELYFREVVRHLMDRSSPELFQSVKGIINAIDNWHIMQGDSELRKTWRLMTTPLLPTTGGYRTSVYNEFLAFPNYTRLTWETAEGKPTQWSMRFVRCIQSREKYKFLPLRNELRNALDLPDDM